MKIKKTIYCFFSWFFIAQLTIGADNAACVDWHTVAMAGKDSLAPALQINSVVLPEDFFSAAVPRMHTGSITSEHIESLVRQVPFVHVIRQALLRELGEDSSAAHRRHQGSLKVYNGDTVCGSFPFDVSALPNIGPIDPDNLYFSAGPVLVANSWLKTTARIDMPASSDVSPLIVPLQGARQRHHDLPDDRSFQVWSSAVLLAMDVLGKQHFNRQSVGIAGVGNGVDALNAFKLGAERTVLLDYNVTLKEMFLRTLALNPVDREIFVNCQKFGETV
ncbi:MAG: hypothetical protein NC924_03100 [Candidatus Omnitrophica bacterium]|nr:hypothetical protein [Candidatus Omnitrophota bacterium]